LPLPLPLSDIGAARVGAVGRAGRVGAVCWKLGLLLLLPPIDKSAQDVKPTIIPCASHWRQPDHVTDGPHWEVVVVVAAVVAAVVAVVVAVVVV
jgi:hypothetical protein